MTSNAYGILFDKIDRTAGPLRLSMSPISDSCERYERVHCLYRLLRERANRGQLELVLNRAFYLGQREYSAPSGRPLNVSPAFVRVASLFPDDAAGLTLMTQRERPVSMHHERVGLLGEDVVLLGSANYARPNSQNTIEILRSPALHAELTASWHDSDADEVDLVHER